MTITTRAGKGTPLTNDELDANFTDLRDLKAPLASPSFTGPVKSAGDINLGYANVPVKANYGTIAPGGVWGGALTFVAANIAVGNNRTAEILGFSSGASGAMAFNTFTSDVATERMRIGTTGNLLIGATADDGTNKLQMNGSASITGNVGIGTSAYTLGSALQIGRVFSFAADINSGSLGSGWLGSNAAQTYAVTGNYAVRAYYDSALGHMMWSTAPSGTAGAAVSWTERMRLVNSGNLLLGTTADNGADKLQVNGSIKSTGNLSAVNTSAIVNMTVDGIASGTNGGSAVNARVAGVTSVAIGNKSAILGGAYDATPFLYSNSAISTNFGFNITAPAVSGGVMSWRAGSDGLRGTGFLYSDGGGAGVADMSSGIGNGIYWSTTNNYVTLQTVGSERMRINSAGRLLLGTAVDNGGDRLQVAGSAFVSGGITVSGVFGNNPGVIIASSSANNYGMIKLTGSGTGGGQVIYASDATTMGGSYGDSTGITHYVGAATPVMKFDKNGYMLVGTTTAEFAAHQIQHPNQVQGVMNLHIKNGAMFYVSGGAYGNGAACVMVMNANTVTGRAINAGGSINAGGTDYAEYMRKSDDCGAIPKGAVVGVDADGNLTDKWVDAVSFVLKSTDPSYVGGDRWGVGLEGDELEAARQKVDRIAYAGQVPVNVYDATPGQFIVPVQAGARISGIAVNEDSLTLKQYIRAVGIVQNILPDGRANIRVKVA
jgi:hypothetical protein